MVIFRMRRPIQAARRYGSPVRTVRTVVVEPARAACLHASAEAGHAVTIPHCGPMAMLECATPSPLAWEVSHHLADGFCHPAEDEAAATMRPTGRTHATRVQGIVSAGGTEIRSGHCEGTNHIKGGDSPWVAVFCSGCSACRFRSSS
jgi:threonine dehydratase